ncbi:hypothetical protein [Burkholderia sp. Se-20378]|uniref:hypothetical protein n=1 Tax=Burkholderia sp. Se-20378 TaxID=2703899 RepID=UPI0019811887|nr:hypothetical protein [Burkholderia sp. Se-20378]MBN3771190.1 hypothetical protein [Burkholderia sp. Se-20378]
MSNDLRHLVPAGLAEMVNGQLQISAAGWLCVALTKLYDANAAESDKTWSFDAVAKLLDGARGRGFANTGTLLTLAATGAEARCFAGLAREAMEGATPEEVTAAIGLIRSEEPITRFPEEQE